MLNAEKFKEDIKRAGYVFGISNGEIKPCVDTRCSGCMFGNESCACGMIQWLLSEYEESNIEPKSITSSAMTKSRFHMVA